MRKRLISIFIVLILVCSFCGCAQATEDALVAETEKEEQEGTDTEVEEEPDIEDTEPESTEPESTELESTEPESTELESKEPDVGAVADIRDITWEQVEYNVVNLHFIFEDTMIDREIVAYDVRDIVYEDITGDDVDEVLIYCDFANNICDWQLVYFYQIDQGNVTDISPSSEDIPNLENADGGIWNMWIADETMEGYSSSVYKLESYYKEQGILYVEETLYIGYRDGKWELVQELYQHTAAD